MGMTAFEIFGVLKLDKKGFDSDLRSAGKSAKSALGTAVGAGAKIATGAIGATTAALTAATGAATVFAKQSVSAATSFESAFTGVQKTVEATPEEFAQLSDWIMDASTKMASSKEDIAATMEIAGQLGISGVEGLEKFTETMIMLGDTTNLNAEEAASALAKFGNIAGVDAENMDAIGSAIVDLGNHFATTEADIVNMATRLASAGTIAGLSSTEILGLSTAMSSVGIQAEAGGTAMAQTLGKIGNAVDMALAAAGKSADELTKKDQKALDNLETLAKTSGMSVTEFAQTWKDAPIDALTGFIEGLDRINEEGGSVNLTLESLGMTGIRQTNMLKSLTLASDVMADAINTSNSAFETAINDTGELNALQAEAEKRYGTTESQALQTAEAFKNLQVAVGKELTPMYGEFMSFSSAAMQAMTEGFQEDGLSGLMASLGTALSDGLSMVVEKLPGLIEAGADLLGALGQGLIDNADLIWDALVQVADIVWEKSGDLADGLFAGLSALLEKVDFNEMASKMSDFMLNMMREALQAIHDMDGSEIGSNIAEFLQTVFADAGQFIMVGFQIISSLAQVIGESLPELIPTIVEILLNIVQYMIENIDILVDGALQLITGLAEGIIAALPILAQKAPEIVIGLVDALIENLPTILETGARLLGELVAGLLGAIPDMVIGVAKLWGKIKELIQGWFPMILSMGGQIIDNFIAGFIDNISAVETGVQKVVTSVTEAIQDMIDGALQWGKDLIDNFVNGITDFAGKVGDGIAGVAQDVADFIGFSEPEKGPLSDFHKFAPDMIDLFTQGMEDNMDKVEDAANDMALAIKPDMSDVDAIEVRTAEIPEKAKGGLSDRLVSEIEKLIESFNAQQETVIPIYIGNKMIDELVLDANRRIKVKSGGFASV